MKQIKIEFIKEDFEGNEYNCNEDCAEARAADRYFGGYWVSSAFKVKEWSMGKYKGEIIREYSIVNRMGHISFKEIREVLNTPSNTQKFYLILTDPNEQL